MWRPETVAMFVLVATALGAGGVATASADLGTSTTDPQIRPVVTSGPAAEFDDRRHHEWRDDGSSVAEDDYVTGSIGAQSSLSAQPLPVRALRGRILLVLLIVVLVVVGLGAAALGVRPRSLRPRTKNWMGMAEGAAANDETSRSGSGRKLLTDEERIVALLEANGGRVKQQRVVEDTEWSKAKVSRLLSSMEDDDTIARIRLGREKLVFLDGHEPRGVRSALHDDG